VFDSVLQNINTYITSFYVLDRVWSNIPEIYLWSELLSWTGPVS